MFELTEALIAELQTMDTPTVCNALELLVPKRRGYGYTTEPLVCTRPELKPIVGIARTASIRRYQRQQSSQGSRGSGRTRRQRPDRRPLQGA